jgi:hypothetical protein
MPLDHKNRHSWKEAWKVFFEIQEAQQNRALLSLFGGLIAGE